MERNGEQFFQLKCIGPITLLDSSGVDRTPNNAKTLGILALLARSADHRRARRWIESKLWSDRGQAQASGSLRQALTEVRNCLGEHRAGLVSDRRNIALDPNIISISFESGAGGTMQELFEGIDIRDPEFEVWLTTERQNFAVLNVGSEKEQARVTIRNDDNRDDGITIMLKESKYIETQAVGHQISQNLQDFSNVRLISETENQTADMTLAMNLVGDGQSQHVSTQLRLADDSIAWTGSRGIASQLDLDIFSLSNEATEAVLRTARNQQSSGPSVKLRERALDELFSFDAARLRVADGLFSAAFEIRPDPVILAWQAFLRMVIVNERLESDLDGLRDEAQEMARKALENGKDNPTLLALISQVNLFLGVDLDGLELLARMGAKRNQGSALAQMSLCTLALRSGKIDEARLLAQKSLNSTGQGRLTHWAHMHCCLSEIAAGNHSAATLHAESAIALAPSFRPPMRHLYALDVESGRSSRARKHLKTLRAQDPDFSLRMISETPDYPATTLRQSGLLKRLDVEI